MEDGKRERSAIGRALDATAELEAMLRECGHLQAAAHAHDAAAALRLTAALTRRRSPDGTAGSQVQNGTSGEFAPPMDGSPPFVPQTPGVSALDRRLPIAAPRDFGLELVASPRAVAFVTPDAGAALLRHALTDLGWIAIDGTRWTTSWTGATTILRLMRGGRPAPISKMVVDPSLTAELAALTTGLGWRPEPIRGEGWTPGP